MGWILWILSQRDKLFYKDIGEKEGSVWLNSQLLWRQALRARRMDRSIAYGWAR
jgi:hypothetical protein